MMCLTGTHNVTITVRSQTSELYGCGLIMYPPYRPIKSLEIRHLPCRRYHQCTLARQEPAQRVLKQGSICRGGWEGLTPPLVVDDPLTGDRQFWSGGSASTPLPAAARSRWHGGSFHSRFDRPNSVLNLFSHTHDICAFGYFVIESCPAAITTDLCSFCNCKNNQ